MAQLVAGISFCDGRLADTVCAVAVELAELTVLAVFRVSAAVCGSDSTWRAAWVGSADEFGRSGCGARRPALCRTHGIHRPCAVDCGDGDDVRDRVDHFFAIAGLLAIDGSAFCGGFFGHGADGGDEHDYSEPC